MTFTPPPSVGSFGQTVSLQQRIQRIMRDYQEGISIFSELIQNADDAGAKRIEFIVDWRDHSHEWDIFAGAALLVFNDAPFTPEDFEGIQRVDEGSRRTNLGKTGRFGVGFNTIYNLTDYPSILAGPYLSWLDPHRTYATGERPGDKWRLSNLVQENWLGIYEVGHFRCGSSEFANTLFRFPFRTETQADRNQQKREFGTQSVTRSGNIEPLLQKLETEGEDLLIFLKSILEIKVREIEADGTETVRLHLQTLNPDEVSQAHGKMLGYPNSQKDLNCLCKTTPQALPGVSYQHKIQTQTPTETIQSTWRVVHHIGVDPKGQLVKVMEQLQGLQEKAVPWGGAAARIESDRSEPVQGRQFCFLPLPKTTGLPIHIHGYWDLDSSRRSSTDEEGTGNAKPRSDWNRLLATEVVAIACADLIRDLVADVGHRNPAQFYSLWPLGHADGVTNFRVPFLKAVHQHPVIHSNLRDEWIKPDDIRILPPEGQALFEPLTADRVRLVSRAVPISIVQVFTDIGRPFKEINPKNTRNYLKKIQTQIGLPLAEIQQASLKRPEWIVELLRFCLSDGHRDLTGLPLALLKDDTLHRFGEGSDGWIYRPTSPLQLHIFAQFPHWFLDDDIEATLPEEPVQGVTKFTVELVAERLAGLDWWQKASQGTGYLWEPMGDGNNLPNKQWLSFVYQYLATTSLPLSLKPIPLIPGLDGQLHQGGTKITPLYDTSNIITTYGKALNYFKIPIFAANTVETRALQSFFNQHSLSSNILVGPLNPLYVIGTLETYARHNDLPDYDAVQYRELLNYISRAAISGLSNDQSRKEQIKQLPIFPTIDGELVALEHEKYKVGIPEAELPPFKLTIKLLHSEPNWIPLFKVLGVDFLSRPVLIERHLLRAYGQRDQAEQLEMLKWLQSAFPAALEDLRKGGSGDQRLRDAVKDTRLIRCTDGELRSAQRTYQPNARYVIEVLGGDAPVPDMQNVYNQSPGDWLALFQLMGIRDTLQAQDLLDHIKRLQAKLQATSMEAVTESCLRLLKYVEENWLQLQQQKVRHGQSQVTFGQAICDEQWLPVLVDQHKLDRYPGAKLPQQRLYLSREVVCQKEANQAASQVAGILPLDDLPAQFFREMGFSRPTFSQVMKHFQYLINLWNSGSQPSLAIFDHAISCVYSDLNRKLGLQQNKIEDKFKSQPCIWDEKGKFWYPNHVFTKKDAAKYFGRYRLLKGESSLFKALGQKTEISWDDCCDFLANVQRDYPSGIPEKDNQAKADLKCVLATLKYLATLIKQERQGTKSLSLILTEDNRLIPPKEVWIPDVERYVKPVRTMGAIALLHKDVSQELASSKSVGCNSLRHAKEEGEAERIPLSRQPNAKPLAETWQQQLRCFEFRTGLQRLLQHEGSIIGLELFYEDWLNCLQVKIASEIRTDLYWEQRKIAERVKVNSYLKEEQKLLYVRYAPEVGVEFLAESLNELLEKVVGCCLSNKLELTTILRTEPSKIHAYLDEKGITKPLKSVEEEQDSGDVEPSYVGLSQPDQHLPTDQKSDITQGLEPKPNTDVDQVGAKDDTDSSSSERTEKSKDRSSQGAGSGSGQGSNKARRKLPSQSDPDQPSSSRARGGGFSKRTCIQAKREIKTDDPESLSPDQRRITGDSGVKAVMQYESEHQRIPQSMDQQWYNNPGCDIESKPGEVIEEPGDSIGRRVQSTSTSDIRYIEVKSFQGAWPKDGARLTRRQFRFGLEKGSQFWLYVVEYVNDPKRQQIHCIQNPAQQVQEFYFDDGWKEIAQYDGGEWEEGE